MLLEMIALVLEQGSAATQWEALMEPRPRAVAQGQELIEALEVAGLAAHGRAAIASAAAGWWREARAGGRADPQRHGRAHPDTAWPRPAERAAKLQADSPASSAARTAQPARRGHSSPVRRTVRFPAGEVARRQGRST
jgi:hypothetical protein